MDIVQIDHTLVDVMVVDREHRLMPPEPTLRDLYEETLCGEPDPLTFSGFDSSPHPCPPILWQRPHRKSK